MARYIDMAADLDEAMAFLSLIGPKMTQAPDTETFRGLVATIRGMVIAPMHYVADRVTKDWGGEREGAPRVSGFIYYRDVSASIAANIAIARAALLDDRRHSANADHRACAKANLLYAVEVLDHTVGLILAFLPEPALAEAVA